MVGATLASEGSSAVLWDGLIEKVAVPALVAPVLAMLAAGLAILVAYRIVGRQSPGVVTRGFRLGQLGLERAVLALARHQRRAEDDGDHLPRAGRQREPGRQTPTSRPG